MPAHYHRYDEDNDGWRRSEAAITFALLRLYRRQNITGLPVAGYDQVKERRMWY